MYTVHVFVKKCCGLRLPHLFFLKASPEIEREGWAARHKLNLILYQRENCEMNNTGTGVLHVTVSGH